MARRVAQGDAHAPRSRHTFPRSLNPRLSRLQPYPFERLRELLAGRDAESGAARRSTLSIGEPKHPTPRLVLDALAAAGSGLANYPTTAGAPALREAIAALARAPPSACRRSIRRRRCCPVLGSREALFAFAQTVVDASRAGATVVMPNPFYQIYEGAALLAGADALLRQFGAPSAASRRRGTRFPDAVWARTQLVYVCSPDNPTGRVTTRGRMAASCSSCPIATASSIAADECYSEIYFDEAKPPARRARGRRMRLGAQRVSAAACRSAACRSARMRPDCARATSRAMPRSSRRSCSTAPITAPRCRRRSRRRASPRGTTKRTCARIAPPTPPSSPRCSRGSPRRCPARCRTPRSISGRRRPATTPSSRGDCSPSRR